MDFIIKLRQGQSINSVTSKGLSVMNMDFDAQSGILKFQVSVPTQGDGTDIIIMDFVR